MTFLPTYRYILYMYYMFYVYIIYYYCYLLYFNDVFQLKLKITILLFFASYKTYKYRLLYRAFIIRGQISRINIIILNNFNISLNWYIHYIYIYNR